MARPVSGALNRNTSDQVLALTIYIENGFQKKKKIGAVLLGMTIAHTMTWHTCLLIKVSMMLP